MIYTDNPVKDAERYYTGSSRTAKMRLLRQVTG